MTNKTTIADIRREYGDLSLDETSLASSPIDQFKRWFAQILHTEKNDPTAMTIATVDSEGHPDSRIVLLKGLIDENFIFYTNYESNKAIQLQQTPFAALLFYWPEMARQVRIRGEVRKVSEEQSDTYFLSRPLISQLSAIISQQSREIKDRASLDMELDALMLKNRQDPVLRPKNWGGYLVVPKELEFWQGRDKRLHDRIFYFKKNGAWVWRRLAP